MSSSNIINSAWGQSQNSLSDLFFDRLQELNINQTLALELMGMESRTLNGLLSASLKHVDVFSLVKLCEFLNLDQATGLQLYIDQVNYKNKGDMDLVKRNKFITEKFDIANLRKTGFLDNIKNFDRIESTINAYFGFESIYEYEKLNITPAFSATTKTKSQGQIDFWVSSAYKQFVRIQNPHSYDRNELISVSPSLRDFSMELGEGLLKAAQILFKVGVTVIFQQSMTALQTKGATLAVNNKPCIIISDFNKSYASMWHSLIHEIFHVLFDWDEIKENKYCKLSDDEDTDERELEADQFAFEYLLPVHYENVIHKNHFDFFFIEQLAKKEKVHPSIILFEYGNKNKKQESAYWVYYTKKAPKITEFQKLLNFNDWQNPIPANENATNFKIKINTKN